LRKEGNWISRKISLAALFSGLMVKDNPKSRFSIFISRSYSWFLTRATRWLHPSFLATSALRRFTSSLEVTAIIRSAVLDAGFRLHRAGSAVADDDRHIKFFLGITENGRIPVYDDDIVSFLGKLLNQQIADFTITGYYYIHMYAFPRCHLYCYLLYGLYPGKGKEKSIFKITY
jgi:hypothetical protein